MSALALALMLAGCTNGEPELEPAPRGACDPLDESMCALPWPSSFYQSEDIATESGLRLDFAMDSMPINRDNVPLDPRFYNEKDGYSIMGPLLTWFSELDPSNLPSHVDLAEHLTDTVTIVLIDTSTGERIPIFAELDATAEFDTERLLIIRPVTPLRHNTRHVVGIRGLNKASGEPVDVSKGFAALRDGDQATTWDIEGRREHFDDNIFPVLDAQGFARDDLQLAWDFTTVSRSSSLGVAEFIRDDAAERIGPDGPAYVIDEVQDEDCSTGASIGRTIYGNMTVPMYTETPRAGTLLTRGEDGLPFYNGDTQVDFLVRVPCSLIETPRPGFILQYGHGLLGNKGEARTGYLSSMADDYGWVVGAVDWHGMADEDRGAITQMLAIDVSGFAILPERTLQGFVQQDALLRMMRGSFATDPAVTFDGVSVIDTERFAYYGNSQGGILGAGYSGFSTQIERTVLGVGGMPYALLLQRSADFEPFFLVFKAKYIDHRAIALIIGSFQTVWDPGEGAGWAWAMNKEPGEGQPAKQVLLQVGIGDAQVTTLAAHIMARAYDAKTVAPETREIWGVEEAEPGFTGSALVEWFYPDGSEEPVENLPPASSGDTHECPRREPAAQQQLRDFVETGVINQYCDGPCVGLREGFCD